MAHQNGAAPATDTVNEGRKSDAFGTRSPSSRSQNATQAAASFDEQRASIHQAALAFPEMSAVELQELADDIKQNGLAHPIVRDSEGVILDGRNRLRACEIASVEPRFETYGGKNPIGYVISANLKRRHLNESQRALVAARLATLEHGANQAPSGKFAERPDVPTQAAAAAMLNISERSVRSAAIVRNHGSPDLIKAVEAGKVSISAAAKQAKPPPVKSSPPKPQTKPPPKSELKRLAELRAPLGRAYAAVSNADDMKTFRRALADLKQAVTVAIKEATK